MADNDPETAALAFQQALSGDPGNRALAEAAFQAAVLAGRPMALSLAQRLPDDPAALMVRADADIKAGHWQAAESAFARLPTTGPTQMLQPLLTAWAEQGSGDTDAALGILRPYVEGTRSRGLFALHAAMINDLAGRQVEAARLYRVALVEFGTLNLRVGSLVASWQARSGRDLEAHDTIRAMVQSNPDLSIAETALHQDVASAGPRSAVDGVAESYLAMAASLQQQNSTDMAMVLLRLAIELRPDFTSARLLMADTLAARGRAEGAGAMLAAVSPTDPLSSVVRLRQARFAERLGHIDEASRRLQQLAADHPHRPEPLAMLADLQSRQGQFADAIGTYSAAIARVGTPSRTDWPLFYGQGIAYDRSHNWPRAEADFLRALALSPDQPYVLNYLGYAWTEQGLNLAQARQMLERAVSERPNDGAIVDSLGWALLRAGDKPAAITCLERAVELEPEDSTINGHLGDAYQAAGRRREAAIQWRRALILHPAPEDAMRLQAKLSGRDPASLPATAERHVE
jgi:tetratricopeptide (TPR) repeat protein